MPIIDALRRIGPRFDAPRDPPLPVDPLIAAYGQDIGPNTTDKLYEMTNEFGVNAISRHHHYDRLFYFAEGTALGFRAEEKTYKQSHPYVATSPVRSHAAQRLSENSGGQKVAFVESCGLLEIAGGYMASMPIDILSFGGIGWGFGVTNNALMRYRTSTPVVLGFGERSGNVRSNKTSDFPLLSDAALRMAPGTEFEITGQGRVLSNVGFAAAAGYVLRPGVTAGVGLLLGAGVLVRDEVTLNVMALDKPGIVRVTLRNLDEEGASVIARVRAGINFVAGSLTGVLAGGMLRPFAEKMNAPFFEEWINTFTTLNASIYGSVEKRSLVIGSWDFDLNDPDARKAYDCATHLNIGPAKDLAHSDRNCVKETSAKEHEVSHFFGADVGVFGQKLLIDDILRIERRGRLDKTSGSMVYRNAVFTKRRKNILTGIKKIDWEAVSVKQGESGSYEPYLRLHYHERDWDFGKNVLRRLLRFSDALQVPRIQLTGEDKVQLEDVGDRLSKKREVHILADIYFTKEGIANIDRATAAQAQAAFLKVSSIIRKKFADCDFTREDEKTKRARGLINEYQKYLGFSSLSRMWERTKRLPEIREAYFELMGRKIEPDSELFRQAEAFGATVEQLTNIYSPQEVSAFFHSVGKLKGFDYMQNVAALLMLATPEHTLIHELSIKSGEITVANVSQGLIEHPRVTIANELHRLADPQI